MPHPLSTLGIAHTLLSLPPIVAGLYSFVRFHHIDVARRSGQVYLIGLVLSVVTSFGLSSTGGINPGHVLGVLAMAAAFGGALVIPRLEFLGRLKPHLATFGLSFSFFLLLVPGINETLSRVPASHPIATGPQDPTVQHALLGWLVVFIIGFALQARQIITSRRASAQR